MGKSLFGETAHNSLPYTLHEGGLKSVASFLGVIRQNGWAPVSDLLQVSGRFWASARAGLLQQRGSAVWHTALGWSTWSETPSVNIDVIHASLWRTFSHRKVRGNGRLQNSLWDFRVFYRLQGRSDPSVSTVIANLNETVNTMVFLQSHNYSNSGTVLFNSQEKPYKSV